MKALYNFQKVQAILEISNKLTLKPYFFKWQESVSRTKVIYNRDSDSDNGENLDDEYDLPERGLTMDHQLRLMEPSFPSGSSYGFHQISPVLTIPASKAVIL